MCAKKLGSVVYAEKGKSLLFVTILLLLHVVNMRNEVFLLRSCTRCRAYVPGWSCWWGRPPGWLRRGRRRATATGLPRSACRCRPGNCTGLCDGNKAKSKRRLRLAGNTSLPISWRLSTEAVPDRQIPRTRKTWKRIRWISAGATFKEGVVVGEGSSVSPKIKGDHNIIFVVLSLERFHAADW